MHVVDCAVTKQQPSCPEQGHQYVNLEEDVILTPAKWDYVGFS